MDVAFKRAHLVCKRGGPGAWGTACFTASAQATSGHRAGSSSTRNQVELTGKGQHCEWIQSTEGAGKVQLQAWRTPALLQEPKWTRRLEAWNSGSALRRVSN